MVSWPLKRESVMGELGRRFREYMVARGFAPATKESYEYAMVDLFRAYDNVSPDLLTCDQVQSHVERLAGERQLAWSTVNVHVSAFRCFYRDVLKRHGDQFSLPPRGHSRTRPTILDHGSVRLILAAHTNLKHRALLATVYGGGLRVSEACRLRPHHIESAPDGRRRGGARDPAVARTHRARHDVQVLPRLPRVAAERAQSGGHVGRRESG
jgi:integrase/recombinase XerD